MDNGQNESIRPPLPERKIESQEFRKESREKVLDAFGGAFSLLEQTTDDKLTPDELHTKKSLKEGRAKTLDQGKDTFNNDFKNYRTGDWFDQEEGIPIDGLLEFLNKKVKELPINSKEWHDAINWAHVLYRNSKNYFEVQRPKSESVRWEARLRQEAFAISRDERKTGSEEGDLKKAEEILSKRRELVLPKETEPAEPEPTPVPSEPEPVTPSGGAAPAAEVTPTPRAETEAPVLPEQGQSSATEPEVTPAAAEAPEPAPSPTPTLPEPPDDEKPPVVFDSMGKIMWVNKEKVIEEPMTAREFEAWQKVKIGTKLLPKNGGAAFEIVALDHEHNLATIEKEEGGEKKRLTFPITDLEVSVRTPGSAWSLETPPSEPEPTVFPDTEPASSTPEPSATGQAPVTAVSEAPAEPTTATTPAEGEIPAGINLTEGMDLLKEGVPYKIKSVEEKYVTVTKPDGSEERYLRSTVEDFLNAGRVWTLPSAPAPTPGETEATVEAMATPAVEPSAPPAEASAERPATDEASISAPEKDEVPAGTFMTTPSVPEPTPTETAEAQATVTPSPEAATSPAETPAEESIPVETPKEEVITTEFPPAHPATEEPVLSEIEPSEPKLFEPTGNVLEDLRRINNMTPQELQLEAEKRKGKFREKLTVDGIDYPTITDLKFLMAQEAAAFAQGKPFPTEEPSAEIIDPAERIINMPSLEIKKIGEERGWTGTVSELREQLIKEANYPAEEVAQSFIDHSLTKPLSDVEVIDLLKSAQEKGILDVAEDIIPRKLDQRVTETKALLEEAVEQGVLEKGKKGFTLGSKLKSALISRLPQFKGKKEEKKSQTEAVKTEPTEAEEDSVIAKVIQEIRDENPDLSLSNEDALRMLEERKKK